MNQNRVEIELIDGPDDGLKLTIDRHQYQWLMPRITSFPLHIYETIPDQVARSYVSVYRRVSGTNKYKFSGVESG